MLQSPDAWTVEGTTAATTTMRNQSIDMLLRDDARAAIAHACVVANYSSFYNQTVEGVDGLVDGLEVSP